MNLAKRFALLLVGFLFIPVLALINTAPAQAAPGAPYFADECNSSVSDAGIRAYDYGYPAQGNNYSVGECRDDSSNSQYIWVDRVRVDVNPELYFGAFDIDSYVIGTIGSGYGSCHENSENSDSNPPDSAQFVGFRYKNYADDNCDGNY